MSIIQKVSGSLQAKRVKTKAELSAEYAKWQTANVAATSALLGQRTSETKMGVRFDPAPTNLFYIELGGLLVALFTECNGLTVDRDVTTVEEGGVNNFSHKLPGKVKYNNIVLKRGMSISRVLWDWFSMGLYDLSVSRANFSIIQGASGHNAVNATGLGNGYGTVKHWDIENAFPVKYELSELNTSRFEEVVFETVEIAHHGITLSYDIGTPMSSTAVT